MSHLLKRTKKSCLKLLRKISISRPLFVQRLEEDDISSNCNMASMGDALAEEEEEHELTDKQYNRSSTSPLSLPKAPVQSEQLGSTPQQVAADPTSEELEEPNYDENQNNYAIMNGLTCKFFMGADGYEFRRLRQLRSDAASEILEWEPDTESDSDPLDVQFERVHYRQNVRYLRHTPSNSSLDLQQQQMQLQQPQSHQATPLKLSRITPQAQRAGLHGPHSVSVGSKFDGHYHNVIITEPAHDEYPMVKWDINGNSLDEQFDLRTHWDDFDTRWRQLQLQDKRHSQSQGQDLHLHSHSHVLSSSQLQSQKSSHQSSLCTLETWIDMDDAEPLSSLFEEAHSQNHNQHNNHNINNNNNCNLCLKSF